MAQPPEEQANGAPAPQRVLPRRVIHWGFDALYAGLVSTMPLYAAARALRDPKARSRWAAYARDIPSRFGARRRRTGDRACVWVHGVSVGEVKAAARLVTEIERTIPDVEVVISVTTDTGYRVACTRYPGHRVEFYPPDLSWIVNDALDAIRPDLMILVESEFWPNFLFAARSRGLPVALVNGKMSLRSAQRFGKLPGITRHLLDCIEVLCVQLPLYEQRLLDLGVAPGRLHVTGNMKFDNIPIKQDEVRDDEFVRLLGADDGLPIVVAGSTHPGEERALARIDRRLREGGHPMRLVIAPRHPARADTVEADIRREGGNVLRRSRMGPAARPGPGQIVLLDTVGELERVYARADAVFVGGSLVRHGGQNMMEPASLGKPVVVGRHIHNFRGEVEMLLHVDGIIVVRDADGVEATQWAPGRGLRSSAARAQRGARSRSCVRCSSGWRPRRPRHAGGRRRTTRKVLSAATRTRSVAARPSGARARTVKSTSALTSSSRALPCRSVRTGSSERFLPASSLHSKTARGTGRPRSSTTSISSVPAATSVTSSSRASPGASATSAPVGPPPRPWTTSDHGPGRRSSKR